MTGFSFAAGYGVGMFIVPPAEWLVHKFMLHREKKKRTWLNRHTSEAHNDVHHKVYSGPYHYFRDETNKDEVIHFSKSQVATIVGVAAATGVAGERAMSFATGHSDFDAGLVAGFTAAAVTGYIGYEFTHHYMHVIGERRRTINKELGDLIQGGKPDNLLRLSKPLLDDICNVVEKYVDSGKKVATNIALRLSEECQYNRNRTQAHIEYDSEEEVLETLTQKMVEKEATMRNCLDIDKRKEYKKGRRIQKVLRGNNPIGKIFSYLDNHHFVHHHSFHNNLNVFIPAADKALRTKIKSSRFELQRNKQYWLCPNAV